MRAYTEYEYSNTHDMRTASAAVHMIRVQSEQIRENPAEYVARKCKKDKYTGSRH